MFFVILVSLNKILLTIMLIKYKLKRSIKKEIKIW